MFPRSGRFYWNVSGLYYRGSYGYYWSSHTYSRSGSHGLGFGGSYFDPQGGSSKGNGFIVRCVAEPPLLK